MAVVDLKLYTKSYLFSSPYRTVTASAEDTGNEGKYSIDGDRFTYFSGTAAGLTVTYYMGPTSRDLTHILYNWNFTDVDIEWSTDGAAWSGPTTFSGLTATAGKLAFANTAKYIRLSNISVSAGAKAIIYEIAPVTYIDAIDGTCINKLDLPDFTDQGLQTERTWRGGIVPSFENIHRGVVGVTLQQLTDAQVLAIETAARNNNKVTVIPNETAHPELWYNCFWSQINLPHAKKREEGRGGQVSWTECD
ncbi:hypothetical protein OAF54_01230 [bacterium]|nr:hypothetical protein [bacterium]